VSPSPPLGDATCQVQVHHTLILILIFSLGIGIVLAAACEEALVKAPQKIFS
jgi:hypothetical protein